MQIDLIRMMKEDTPEIQNLFERVYPEREEFNEEYWKYMFDNPNEYIPIGLRYNGLLVGYYAGVKYHKAVICINAMVDPDFRGKSLFSKIAWYLYNECERKGENFITLFANKNIHDIYPKYGWKDVCRVREYRVPLKDINGITGFGFYPKKYIVGSYEKWRYKDHPNNTYIYYEKTNKDGQMIDFVIYSSYENRIQIIDYYNIDIAIRLGAFIGKLLKKKIISFWSGEKLKYPYIKLDLWYMFKNFKWGEDKDLKKYLKTIPLFMGMNDVY